MPIRITLAVLAAGLALAAPAEAADARGRFAVDGAGAAPCTLFLDAARKKDQRYFMIAGWLEGFFTGMNLYEKNTFDITPWQSTDLLAVALTDFCRRNPASNIQQAAAGIAGKLMPDRLRERSPLITAGKGNMATPLYQATLREAQARLAALGHLKAKPSGTLDRATRNAFTAYQRRLRLPVTGIPDQATLLVLMNARIPGMN